MLISFLAPWSRWSTRCLGLAGLSLQQIFGWVFAPIAWAMGVPWRDAPTIGNLLGTRMALNEFVAYAQLGPLKDALDPRSFTIATFALCGLRELQLDRHPDRRHRRAGAVAPARPRAARGSARCSRHAGEFRHRDDRGLSALGKCLRPLPQELWQRIGAQGVNLKNAS
jgi:hypothetical protein